MSLLSKQAETKLITAIEAAAAFVNDGMAPNAAIVKSATENAVPPGHIDLMVHAYNTGRTTKQRESGENTLEKAADFPMADISEIKATLFGENVKTSAAIKAQQAVSPEYALNPVAMIKRATNLPAPAAAPFTPTFTRPPRDEHAQVRREYSQKRAEYWAGEEARRQVTAAYQKAAAKFDELLHYFRTPSHLPYADVMHDVRLVHGDHGVSVLQKIAAMYPMLEKEAARNYRIIPDTTARALVGEVLDLVNHYNELNAVYTEKSAQQASRSEKKVAPEITTGSILFRPEDEPLTLKEAARRPGPPPAPRVETLYNPAGPEYKATWDPIANEFQQIGGLKAEPPKPAAKPSDKTLFDRVGYAATPARFVGSAMGIGAEKADKSREIAGKNEFNAISDPDQDGTIKNIRAKSVLHDLIINDPIVSAHDPQDVAMAFNDIAELAPNLVDTPGMLQTVLRKRLESGSLADFDVKQILEMDKLRAERDKVQGEARRVNMEIM